MNMVSYPAIFHDSEEKEKGSWISFPDFAGVYTDGDTVKEAYDMCIDALGLALTSAESNEQIPVPTAASEIRLGKGEQVMLICFDLDEYVRKNNSRPVKKTLSIPGWLNEKAVAAGVNFSAILQKALKEELGL